MSSGTSSFGLWGLAAANAAVLTLFASSFHRFRTARDWRTFGAFAASVVALFAEMYGFPLTLFLLAGWLGSRAPGPGPFSHEAGHLWNELLGWRGDPHLSPLHLAGYVPVGGGFLVLAAAWPVLLDAQRSGHLATSGPYARVRHPQYAGFVLIMLGFLLQWPTALTLLMFPVLVMMYTRLARQEERDAAARFGAAYARYAAAVPAFVPRRRRPVRHPDATGVVQPATGARNGGL
jgi:protein-S-isoprenylcysteine O-methyltransferase Ste14